MNKYIVFVNNLSDPGNHGFISALVQVIAENEDQAKNKAIELVMAQYADQMYFEEPVFETSVQLQEDRDAVILYENGDYKGFPLRRDK